LIDVSDDDVPTLTLGPYDRAVLLAVTRKRQVSIGEAVASERPLETFGDPQFTLPKRRHCSFVSQNVAAFGLSECPDRRDGRLLPLD